MEVYLMALVLLCTVLSVGSIWIAFKAIVEVEAFKKSTHRVQYVGASKENIKVSDSIEDSNNIDQINKNYKQDLEDVLPFFAPDEDDTKLKPRRSL